MLLETTLKYIMGEKPFSLAPIRRNYMDIFLIAAIAALRDDTDNNQMFINGKGDWGICRDNTEYGGLSGIDFYGMPNDLNVDNYHKATVEELIEHFKGKEESCQDL